jgi:hypothetical protein
MLDVYEPQVNTSLGLKIKETPQNYGRDDLPIPMKHYMANWGLNLDFQDFV